MQNICMRKEACLCARFCWLANYLHACASEMDLELFISEVKKRPATWDPWGIGLGGGDWDLRDNLGQFAFSLLKRS